MQHEPAGCRPRSRRLIGRVLVVAAISTGACACGDMSSSSPVDTRYDFAACQDVWSPATDADGSDVKGRGGAYGGGGVGWCARPAPGALLRARADGEFPILRVSSEGLGSPARLAVGWDPGAAS